MRTVLVAVLVATGLAACSSADGQSADAGPKIVVTTNILGDVVEELVGEAADVEVLMPPNADPHEFAASAQQAASMRTADALVVNGLGFEEGLLDTVEAAEDDGVTVITATDAIEPLPLGAGEDPHLFTDPARMRTAASHIADALVASVPELDTPVVADRVATYVAALDELDTEVEGILDAVPAERRVLVTNHEVFGYFADRFDFEVLGAIIPGGSTLAEPSPADLDALVDRDRAAPGARHLRGDLRAGEAGRRAGVGGRRRGGGGALQRVARRTRHARSHLPRHGPHQRRADRGGPGMTS